MKTILIVASNSSAVDYVREAFGLKDRSSYVHVRRPDQLMGLRPENAVVVFYGNWYEVREKDEIKAYARAAGLRMFTMEDDRYL